MSKILDPLSAASAEMLTAAASLVHELVESVRKDGQKFKLAYDGLRLARPSTGKTRKR